MPKSNVKASKNKLLKWLVPIIYLIILLVSWTTIFLATGFPKIISWWFVQLVSPIGVITFIVSVVFIIKKLIKGNKSKKNLLTILILSLIMAWPLGWFFGIGQIAYPADIESVEPKISIRLPLNKPAIVGWGGDSIEKNYHVTVPFQRWAYDLTAEPALTGSSKLEDYGIYGMDLMAPASGTIVSAHDGDPDITPGESKDEASSLFGNHIFIRLEETGTYLVIAHLKEGSVLVKEGERVEEGAIIAQVGNSGNTTEPHIHIHHQRQDPSKTSIFLAEGLPLFFRDIDGPKMPEGGMGVKDGKDIPIGDIISPLNP